MSGSPQSDDKVVNPENIPNLLEYADQLKTEGNEHFKAGKWGEALASYQVALGSLPKRKEKEKAVKRDSAPEILDDDELEAGKSQDKVAGKQPETNPSTEEEEPMFAEDPDPFAKTRATLNANIAACYMKLGEDKEVVAACTQSLLDDPEYVKALQRRATSNERINTWNSLASAQEDYQKLVELLPEASKERRDAERKMSALKPRVEEAQKRETAEMLDKLKGIGNNILGKFGLSTDNFQFVPNGQGGYSMNFQR
uniref:Putative TPR-like protein n=1 Tax=Moniliophthora roreri TaxID=221103 RepID=A0A0W0EUQ3_MONRR